MTSELVKIKDPAIIERAKKQAAALGRTDWRVYLAELATLGARAILGLSADLTVKQAAQYMGDVHPNTVKNYHKRGQLPYAYYTSSRRLMIPVADLDALKASTVRVEEAA